LLVQNAQIFNYLIIWNYIHWSDICILVSPHKAKLTKEINSDSSEVLPDPDKTKQLKFDFHL